MNTKKLTREEISQLEGDAKWYYWFWRVFLSKAGTLLYVPSTHTMPPPQPSNQYVLTHEEPWVSSIAKVDPKTNNISTSFRVDLRQNPDGEAFLKKLDVAVNGKKINPIEWRLNKRKTFVELSVSTDQFDLQKKKDRTASFLWLFYHISLVGKNIEELLGVTPDNE